MSGELLLINPSRRKKRGSKSRRKHHKRHSARRHNPVRAHRRHRRHSMAVAHRSYRRRRRNPISMRSFGMGGIVGKATGALMGAGGAILNDALFTYVPLPAMLKSGPLAIASKFATALGVGYLSSFVIGKSRGAQLAEGALTVLAYQVVKPMVATVLPLAGDDIEGLGYYSPGMILQDSLSPLTDLNAGTPLQAYISGLGGAEYTTGGGANRESDLYDSSIDAYIE